MLPAADPQAGSGLSWWCHTQSRAVGGKSAPQCQPLTLHPALGTPGLGQGLSSTAMGHQRLPEGGEPLGQSLLGCRECPSSQQLQVIINRLIKSPPSTSL